jgi:hypothetical protein
MPAAIRTNQNMFVQKPPVGDGGNSFKAGALVQIAAGVLVAVPSTTAGLNHASQYVYGQTPDDSKAAGLKPPDAFFGENHYCFDIAPGEIEMNITNAAGGVGDAVTNNGAAGPQLSAVTIGAAYGIKFGATNYAVVHFVDLSKTVDDGTAGNNTVVRVVGIVEGQALTDYNGRVRVKILPRCVQG